MSTEQQKLLEARQWLTQNNNPYPFAGNRFGPAAQALRFVEQLYDAGAVKVQVASVYAEDWRIAQEGGPYADMLVVTLPTDAAQRHALFQMYKAELEQELGPEAAAQAWDAGQPTLRFWWD